MRLHYVKVNPAENMTIFILDQISAEYHREIANKLMNYNNLHGEQVGFIQKEGSFMRLQMMGGEFCGNATRSLAAYMVHSGYPGIKKVDNGYQVELKTSGVEETIRCLVRPTDKENIYYSQIDMPLPLEIKEESYNAVEAIKVHLPGIVHIIVDASKIEDEDEFFQAVKAEMDKMEYDAFGIMFYDKKKGFIKPLVYVKATDSLYWERSCASGTCALGVALAYEENKPISKSIHQPGGNLEVHIGWKDGKVAELKLDGPVEIVSEGIVYIGE